MKIVIDLDVMTVADLEEVESAKIARIRGVLGKFVLDDNGQPLKGEEGAELLKQISVNEFMKQARALTTAIKNEVPQVLSGN